MKRILLVTFFCLLGMNAYAANEYLQGGSHCETATLEPYASFSNEESGYLNDYYNGTSNDYKNDSEGERWTIGIRLRIALGSTCTKEYKTIMLQNTMLKQQLEMLKMCARYKGLDLGPEFSEVRRMCAGVQGAKPTKDELPPESTEEQLKDALMDAESIIERLREKQKGNDM